MNILLVHKLTKVNETQVTFGAVDYYRMQMPFKVLGSMTDIKYATTDSLKHEDGWLKQFELIIFSRTIKQEDIDKLNRLGIMFALDLDDYWHLPQEHILYEIYKENKTPELIENSIRSAHFVTCTTEILAEKIKPLNPNVHVIENGIDDEDPIWQPEKTKSERIRFGFTGGSTHIPDVAEIAKDVARSLYDTKFYHNAQVVLCGYNAEPRIPSPYVAYERMLTDDHKPLKYFPEYCHELKIQHRVDGKDKPYRRIWNKDISEFPVVYDELDVVIAPLKDSEFNRCKSNIKMLEAGFKDCAVMVSDIPPYSPLATKENSFLLSEKNFFEWQRYILNNPNCLGDKKAALRESVAPYSLKKLTPKRLSIYESYISVLK